MTIFFSGQEDKCVVMMRVKCRLGLEGAIVSFWVLMVFVACMGFV